MLDVFSFRRVPPHYATSQFPGGHNEIEVHVAELIASSDFLGNVDADELGKRALVALLRELIDRCPNVNPAAIFESPRFFAETVTLLDRGHLAGPPLRYSWFTLGYNLWILIAGSSGLELAKEIDFAKRRENALSAMNELGIECSSEDCDEMVARFRVSAVDDVRKFPLQRNVSFATGALVQYIRFLHLAAIRHRAYVGSRFIEAGVFLVAAEEDREVAGRADRYLSSHGVYVIRRAQDTEKNDHLLAVLSERSAVSEDFWREVSGARHRGLRPTVLALCPRTDLVKLRGSVAQRHEGIYEWLTATAVVKYERDNMRGFVSVLRALEPASKWWWRDDAIQEAIATNPFSIFDDEPQSRRRGGITTRPYPVSLNVKGITDGLRLANGSAATTKGQERAVGAERGIMDSKYSEVLRALHDRRIDFPGGYYQLPWFIVAYHAKHRILLAQSSRIEQACWDETDIDHIATALYALGIHTKSGEVQRFFETFLELPWNCGSSETEAIEERVLSFIALVDALSAIAFSCNRKIQLQLPLYSAFVSYTSSDAELATTLVNFVERNYVADIWWDSNSISMGQRLTEALENGIASSERFVLIASPESALSEYVQLEADMALEMKKPTVVVLPRGPVCPEWATRIEKLQKVLGKDVEVLVSGADIDASGPVLAALLTRNPTDKVQWLRAQTSRLSGIAAPDLW